MLESSIFLVILVFLEYLFPRNRFKYKSNNLFWFGINFVVLPFLVFRLVQIFHWVLQFVPMPVLGLASYPATVQFVIFLLLSDFLRYWFHFAFHRSNFLWQFHIVHHSSEDINALASFKQSWLELIPSIFMSVLLAHIIKVQEPIVAAVNLIFFYVCIWQHSNIRYRFFDKINCGAVLITPSAHRIHHECEEQIQHKNLGFIFTFWDKIFGTYTKIESTAGQYGIKNVDYPHQSNLRQFLYPLWRAKQKQ